MTIRMHRISKTLRRLRPRRPLLFDVLTHELDLTWTDIMNDLDPAWHVGDWGTATKEGEAK